MLSPTLFSRYVPDLFPQLVELHADCNIGGLIPAGLPQGVKLPVMNLLTGQKSGFSPRRGDSLH